MKAIVDDLAQHADPDRIAALLKYFHATPGGYGFPDEFIGVRVPDQRQVAARHWKQTSAEQALQLLESPVHEHRLTALFILTRLWKRGVRHQIIDGVLSRIGQLNNWDLIDTAGPHLLGPHLLTLDPEMADLEPLVKMAGSEVLWERRLAMLSTQPMIRAGLFHPTLVIAEQLVPDREDLIGKAVGWMLREVGDRDRAVEEAFLQQHHSAMLRVALRYAIEKFPPDLRQHHLRGL